MDKYTYVATCRIAAYICVCMVPVECEKYSAESEILDENSKFPTFYTRLLSFMLYSDYTNGHVCTPFNMYVFRINLGACVFLEM